MIYDKQTITAAINEAIHTDGSQMKGGRQIDIGILRQVIFNKLPGLGMQEYREALTTMRESKVLVPAGGTQLWSN